MSTRYRNWFVISLSTLCLSHVLVAATAQAQGKYNKVLAIGDRAPGWTELPGTDGDMHRFSELNESAVLVICFTSNTCLYSKDYEDRLVALSSRYATDDQSVRLVAISSNAVRADDLVHM